jgi:hypothetical protein
MYVVDSESGDTLQYSIPDEAGKFRMRLARGTYELHFSGEGYEELISPLEITEASDKQGIRLEENLLLARISEEIEPVREVEVFEGDDSKIGLKETHVEHMAGLPLAVPLVAPRGSVLFVRTYQDGKLVSTDTLVTQRRRTQLQLVPPAGISQVEVELTDEDGNIHRNRLLVVGSVPEDEYLNGIEPEQGDDTEHGNEPEQESGEEPFTEAETADPEETGMSISESPGQSPELSQLYEEALKQSEGFVREILQSIDFQRSEILTVDQLINYVDHELAKREIGTKEREKILSRLFGEQYSSTGSARNKSTWLLLFFLALAAGGLIWILARGWKRHEKGDAQGN